MANRKEFRLLTSKGRKRKIDGLFNKFIYSKANFKPPEFIAHKYFFRGKQQKH